MRLRTRWLPLLALLPALPLGAQETASADARLRALYTAEWEWRQGELSPRSDGSAFPDRFPRVDAASQQARLEFWTRVLAALDSIPFDQLSEEERINAQVLRASLRALANDIRFGTYEAPFNSDTFFWTAFTPRQGFESLEEYRSFLVRLRTSRAKLGQQTSR